MRATTSPTATIARWAVGPDTPPLTIAFLQLTFKALCAAQETVAARKPRGSNVGLFHDEVAIPIAIGRSVNKTFVLGRD